MSCQKSVDKRHPVLRCNCKYSCVDGYNKQVNSNTTVWKEPKIMCQLKTYHCETVSSVWVGLHVKCYFRPTQVRKIWTMLAKIPIITFQENRSVRRRTMLCRGRDTMTLTATFSNRFSMRLKIICGKILCYWVFLLDTLVQRSGVTIRHRPDGPGIESRRGRDF
jgi:hypothetical protein